MSAGPSSNNMSGAGAPPAGPARAAPPALTGLAPVVSPSTVVLVLGSFPSERSLADGQYYANPRNQFWRILQAVWPHTPLPLGAGGAAVDTGYGARLDWLLARGLGLWDVYASCRREGSLDAAIRDARPNDIGALARTLPRLAAIAHNGAQSHRLAGESAALGLAVHRLPSSSAAHAAWSFERKLEAWRAVFEQHGLV